MSDQPKVSERMRDLVITLEADAANYECRGGNYALVELREGRNALLSAIAEIEQREEKWKEAAMAIYEAAMCARGIMMTKRVEVAFAALGDEWNEAVR